MSRRRTWSKRDKGQETSDKGQEQKMFLDPTRTMSKIFNDVAGVKKKKITINGAGENSKLSGVMRAQ